MTSRLDVDDCGIRYFGGVGLGDFAAASICLQRARERGVGVMLER